MMLLEFSMTPLGKGESVSKYVARSLDIIDRSGLDYRLHAMGTIIEGEPAEVLAVLQQCLDAMTTCLYFSLAGYASHHVRGFRQMAPLRVSYRSSSPRLTRRSS